MWRTVNRTQHIDAVRVLEREGDLGRCRRTNRKVVYGCGCPVRATVVDELRAGISRPAGRNSGVVRIESER